MNSPEKRPSIVVIGSSNTDMVVKAESLPKPGETILGDTFYMIPGGKGANQAITAARLGADVTFVSKIGYDLFGLQAMEIYRKEKIDTRYISTDPTSPSGVALVYIDVTGENSIVVAPGAVRTLSKADIDKARERIKAAEVVLIQCEVALETAEYAASVARGLGVKVLLKPAPMPQLTDTFCRNIDVIMPNRIEAEKLTGMKITDSHSAMEAAKAISSRGIENVIITLGRDGAVMKNGDVFAVVPALETNPVDTTGAGDVFCGAFSVWLSQGHTMLESVQFACTAAAISVTRIGAQTAIPYIGEVLRKME